MNPTTKGTIMLKTFTKLAQANLDHYNNHPTQHNIITGVLLVAGVVGVTQIPRRIAGVPKD